MTENTINNKKKLFDRWAPTYDTLFPSVFYQAIHKRLLEYVDFCDRPNVLDLGCGTGRLLDRLATEFPTLCGTGLDLSAEMILQARKKKRDRHRPRLIFIPGNAEELPFAEGQFDAVFNTISFLHYPNPERVLSEVSRVLHSGGQFYLVDFTNRWATHPQHLGISPTNIRIYSPQVREQLGQQVGLEWMAHHALFGPVFLTIFRKKQI